MPSSGTFSCNCIDRTTLNPTHRGYLEMMPSKVSGGEKVAKIISYCEQATHKGVPKRFSFLYAAILLAVEGKVGESLELFRLCDVGPFEAELQNAVRTHGLIAQRHVDWTDPRPFDIWTKTEVGLAE